MARSVGFGEIADQTASGWFAFRGAGWLMRFSFPHSHAFPGGEVRVEDAEAAEGMCVVEFGDGIAMIGEWHPDGDDIHLSVPAYRTARGTDVEARRWRLVKDKVGSWRSRRSA